MRASVFIYLFFMLNVFIYVTALIVIIPTYYGALMVEYVVSSIITQELLPYKQ